MNQVNCHALSCHVASVYANHHTDGNPLANLTAYVGDKNVRVLSLDRFHLFSTGVAMNVPAVAKAVLNFADPSQNEWYDWTPLFTPLMPQPNSDGEIS